MEVSASRRGKIEHYENTLTLANDRVSSNAKCEVNIIRK